MKRYRVTEICEFDHFDCIVIFKPTESEINNRIIVNFDMSLSKNIHHAFYYKMFLKR